MRHVPWVCPFCSAVIQLMAAAKAKRGLAFFTFEDEMLKLGLQQTHHLLVIEGTTVGEFSGHKAAQMFVVVSKKILLFRCPSQRNCTDSWRTTVLLSKHLAAHMWTCLSSSRTPSDVTGASCEDTLSISVRSSSIIDSAFLPIS